MTELLIKLIALIAAGTGLYVALPDFGIRNILSSASLFRMYYPDLGYFTFAWFISCYLISPVIPIAKLIAAIGLVRFQRWAWQTAIISLTIDLFLRVAGAINFAVQSYRFSNQELHIPKGATVATVHYISMWPSYIIGFLCGFSILVLLMPSVKRKFEQVTEHIA